MATIDTSTAPRSTSGAPDPRTGGPPLQEVGSDIPSARPEALTERVERLIELSEQIPDPGARELVGDLTSAIMDLYGEGLARIGAALRDAGPAGAELRERLIADGVVASLLLMHDLHPVPLQERVLAALDSVRPYMESHEGGVELLEIEDGVARLRLQGSCHGCAASQATLELAIKEALDEHAPDLLGMEVEGVAESKSHPAPGPCEAPNAIALPMAAPAPTPTPTPSFSLPMVASGAPSTNPPAPVPASDALTFPMTPPAELVGLANRELPPIVAMDATSPAPAARAPDEHCELCGVDVPAEHRHLLHLEERRILCVCHSCLALRSGDPTYRPTGTRTLWLEDFDLDDETWSAFGIPIGLAFFLNSGSAGGIAALYPSPAGATECELPLDAWERLEAANPVLRDLEPDAEALIVNRMADPPQHAIVPIDECYRLIGLIKSRWEGISGGAAIESAVPEFFAELRTQAVAL
jgi:Fe-S cluster biogenesis protein NfuA